jgi:hypothetical protein
MMQRQRFMQKITHVTFALFAPLRENSTLIF